MSRTLDQSANETIAPQSVAGDRAVLARRYANALYGLAEEQKQLEAVAEDLRGLAAMLGEYPDFRAMTQNPRLKGGELASALEKIATAAKFGKLTGNFLQLLARNRRLDLLGPMIAAFLACLAAKRGEFSAEVETAKALTPAQQEQLATQLEQLAGGKVHIVIRESPDLLGGLRIKMGSRLIDASVKGKLARLERALKSQQEAA